MEQYRMPLCQGRKHQVPIPRCCHAVDKVKQVVQGYMAVQLAEEKVFRSQLV